MTVKPELVESDKLLSDDVRTMNELTKIAGTIIQPGGRQCPSPGPEAVCE